MLESFSTVIQQVFILFVLIGIGFFITKKKIFNEKTIEQLTTFVLYFVTPAAILESFDRPFDSSMLQGFFIAFAAASGIHILSICIAHLFIRSKDIDKNILFRFGIVFSNSGYMALPLQQALLGSEGVFYGSTFIAVFNIFVWTYGIAIMSSHVQRANNNELNNPKKQGFSFFKPLINPGIISVLLGLALFLTSFKLPFFVQKPVHYLALLNTPLPMILIGFYIGSIKNMSLFKDWYLYWGIFLRLIFIPCLTLIILYFSGLRGTLLTSLIIAASAPVGATSVMFSVKFNKDAEKAGTFIALSTLFSIITMPFIVALSQFL